MLFTGIILAVMADTGPLTEINFSPLDETSVMKLSISLMTALGLGETQEQLNQLHGPFVVPGRKELAIAYPFNVSAPDSSDPRIQESGRYCTIFLIFSRDTKSSVLSKYNMLESILTKELEPIKKQEQLSKEYLTNLYSNIENTITTIQETSSFASTKEAEDEIERAKSEQERQQILSGVIRDITETQISLTKILDEFMVFTDPPILEGSLFMKPQIKPEEFLKILPLISHYEKVLSRFDGENIKTVRDVVYISILVRIGNLFYWKALISNQKLEYEKSIEFYLRANQLKDDSILYLTIGSIYRKLNRLEEAKDWIEGGFERMRKRKESIRINRNMLFGDII